MSKVIDIGGLPIWSGEPMEDTEHEDMIKHAEYLLEEIKKGRWRGFAFAAVSAPGIAGDYYLVIKQKTGCSSLGLIGAVNLLRFEVEALSSSVVGQVEEDE